MVDDLRDRVRQRYAEAARKVLASTQSSDTPPPLPLADQLDDTDGAASAGCCGPTACCTPVAVGADLRFGAQLYDDKSVEQLPADALTASLGCGNPTAVADLRPGERVLDLGSGGGIDVLLSARRVGPKGFVYGVDMTDEMLELARTNAVSAGATNVSFLRGTIEAIPLPDAAVDVVISNCVINLSTDKPAVIGEMHRVLVPGGRIGISDVVADDNLTPHQRGERGSYVGCIAGALSRSEYLSELAAAGFVEATVETTHEVADGMHAAIIRATKHADGHHSSHRAGIARSAP